MANTQDIHPIHADYIAALSSAIEATREALLAAPHPIAWHAQIVAIRAASDELKKAHRLADELLAEMYGGEVAERLP